MSAYLNYYYLYKILDDAKPVYLLLRVVQPAYCNADQGAEEQAEKFVDARREQLLGKVSSETGVQIERKVGLFTGSPEGDGLYGEGNGHPVELWYAHVSGYGDEYIVLHQAKDETEFWRFVEEDSEINNLPLVTPAIRITARYYA